MNLVPCVSIKRAQNSQVLIQLSPVSCNWTEPMCGIKHGSTPYLENKNIIVQRRRGFFMLLFPLPLARNKKNEYIENRIMIGCAPCTMIPVYILCRPWGKDCCRRGRILKHCIRDELKESRILLSKISTPCLTFLIPFLVKFFFTFA